MLERSCCSCAAVLFAAAAPGLTVTISSEMFYMSTIVKDRRLFEKFISGNIVLK